MNEGRGDDKIFSRTDVLYFISYLIIFLLLFFPFFFRPKTFYERDSTLLETPLRQLTADLLREGNLALWTESHGNGQPHLANPKTAIFYPTTWLYLILPFFVAFKIHYFIHPLLGWLGMYFLGKRWELSPPASFLSSSLFFFSGMYLSSFEFYNHIAAICWLMWLLFFLSFRLQIKSRKFLLAVLSGVLLILAGTPEFILMAGFLGAVQAIILSADRKEFYRRFVVLVLVFVLAAGICAVQLLPSFELLSQTERSRGTEIWPLEMVQLLNLIFPGILGESRAPGHDYFWGGHIFNTWYPLYYSLYVGAGFFILAFLSFEEWRKKKVAALLSTAAVAFIISCGKYSPFFIIYKKLPFLSSIRFPVKFFLISVFCLAILAGIGWDRWRQGQVSRKISGALILLSSLIFLVLLALKTAILKIFGGIFVLENNYYPAVFKSLLIGTTFLLISSFLIWLGQGKTEWKKAVSMILLVLAIGDQVFHNRYINPTVDYSHFNKPKILAEIGPSPVIYRDTYVPFYEGGEQLNRKKIFQYSRETLFPYSGLMNKIKYILNDDFMSSYPEGYKEAKKYFNKLETKNRIKILRYFGCQYYLGFWPLQPGKEPLKIIYFPDDKKYPCRVEKIPSPGSGRYLVGFKIRARNSEESLRLFVNDDFDYEKAVIVSDDLNILLPDYYSSGHDNTESFRASLQILEEKNGSAHYRVNVSREAALVIASNYSPGWKAWIDGRKAQVFAANIFSRAVVVPAGEHTVEMRYLPSSFIIGLIISAVFISGFLGFLLVKKRSGKIYIASG
ncbi:MAG: YfhO family protein [Candidatus Aminicenantes bacterium]|nr:YfhO family protein [Candidatus Aminicenantes bacterium]